MSDPDPSSLAQARRDAWRALHPDIERALGTAALRGLALEGRRCLDVDTRLGTTADALQQAGASVVWMTDRESLLPDALRRRFVLGEPGWLRTHPRLADEVGRFDLVVCAAGLWRGLDPSPATVRGVLEDLRGLLTPGGLLRLVLEPGCVVGEPTTTRLDARGLPCNEGPVLRVVQALEHTRHEIRLREGVEPSHERGPALTPEGWVIKANEAGFELVTTEPFDAQAEDGPGLVLLTARRPATLGVTVDGDDTLT